MAAGFSLKDQLFNAEKVAYLGGLFAAASGRFDAPAFQARVMARLPELELKQRIAWIGDCLAEAVPGSLDTVAPVIRAALPPPLDPTLGDDDFGDFIFAPLGDWVAAVGLESPEPALDLLAEITQRFSMEWAVRPFLVRWPEPTLARMRDWSGHSSYHVRRLVSEGTRPRLPWGQSVAGLTPDDTLPLLDVLHGDVTRYVTRSVANHLNDITRKHPVPAMDRVARWRAEGRQSKSELDWIAAHALRNLVKSGNARAMTMLGFDPDADIRVTRFAVPESVEIGARLEFAASLMAPDGAAALVDYVLWRRKADGQLGRKVFKLKQLRLDPGRPAELARALQLKSDATTYRLYPGLHRLELQINGRVRAGADFRLLP